MMKQTCAVCITSGLICKFKSRKKRVMISLQDSNYVPCHDSKLSFKMSEQVQH